MIRVNVISGFLGAGKTTLIKHLAAALTANSEKTVILENEFGEVGIDGKMLELEGLSVFEISSGCICCTLKSDFLSTLVTIADKISPDRILIEPSGIFVPDEIQDIFKNPQVSARMTLCSVLTVVDCTNFLKQRHRYGYFFENQISNVDRLILSKIDGIDSDAMLNIMETLQSINSKAEILSKQWESMIRENFLSLLSHPDTESESNPPGEICEHCGSHEELYTENHEHEDYEHEDHEHHEHENHAHGNHLHSHGSHGFMAFGIFPQGFFTVSSLSEKLSRLGTGSYGTVLRAKGHVRCMDNILAFDYVNGKYEIRQINPELPPSICFIGEDLDKNRITSMF